MLTIQSRAYAGEADIHAIVELQAAARRLNIRTWVTHAKELAS